MVLYAEAVIAPLQGFGDGLVYGLNKQVCLCKPGAFFMFEPRPHVLMHGFTAHRAYI